MNTKQEQREIDKAAWRIHRSVCQAQQQDKPGSGFLLLLILLAVGYWLAHCV